MGVRPTEEWVSGLHISHTFMKNYGTNKHPAKNFSNADFISVNCVGLTPIDFFTENVKEGFYRSLATKFMDSQVIILENDPPPVDLAQSTNIIEFTGISGVGRKGFIPENG